MPSNITIPYSRWLFGKEAVETGAYLKHPKSGKMDIVGFLLETWLGQLDYIKGKRFPSQMAAEYIGRNRTFEQPLSFLITTSHTDTAEVLQLMELNDNPELSNDKREALITKFLKKYGIDVKFVSKENAPNVIKTYTAKIRAQQRRPAGEPYVDLEGHIRFRASTINVPDYDTDLAAALNVPDPAEL